MESLCKTRYAIDLFMQETGDGELMVLHDLHSVLAASQQFEINKDIMAELARAGLQPEAPATSTWVSTHLACWKPPCLWTGSPLKQSCVHPRLCWGDATLSKCIPLA